MRMIQSGDGAGFALKALEKVFERNFDRYRAVQARIARFVDLPHSTRADGRKDFIGAESVTYREGHGYWNNSNPQA
jgi:hypothetical protein